MKKLCIFHANCADGFTAAWVVKKKFEDDVEFHKGFYGENPPDVTNRDVIIVDFSYKRDVLLEIGLKASSILVLDHHKSAALDLEGFPNPAAQKNNSTWANLPPDGYDPNLPRVLFDMERSGAMITWDYFFPDEKAPDLVKYVQDRDIWKFQLPNSKEHSVNLFSYEYTFENWDKIAEMTSDQIISEGTAILRKHDKDIAEFIEANKNRRITLLGFDVPIINVPYTFGSDICHILAKGEPFAVYYYDLGNDRMFGLRSAEDGEDVSIIASKFGGGGHKHAAGFKLVDFNVNLNI